jgi:hypothetical protein
MNKSIERSISTLLGLTLASVDVEDDVIRFRTTCGRRFLMNHHQDCCEIVYIESVTGDVADLIGSPILRAEESVSDELTLDMLSPNQIVEEVDKRITGDTSPRADEGSKTWTFYKLATRKGYVDIRWYGTSNGYYSESVTFEEIK